MEVFASKDIVKPTSLHVYQLHSQKNDYSFYVIHYQRCSLANNKQIK